MRLKNRVVMAPMGLGAMAGRDGYWGERVRQFYLARARGGVGLITTGLVFVSRDLEAISRVHLNLYSDRHLDSLRQVVDDAHGAGAKVSAQLTAGFGRVVTRRWLEKRFAPPVSASDTPCYFEPERLARALSMQEVKKLTLAFGAAADRCKAAGIDAVELHGHEGYLMDQFMSGIWNKRADEYGGTREKRLTFALQAVCAIRDAVGDSLSVIYRIGMDHHLEGGRSTQESIWIVRKLEEMGVDAFHVDAGCYETSWWPHPPTYQPAGCMVDMAALVKQAVNVPVIAVGKLHRPQEAERVLSEGKADFIAIGRGLLADPEWVKKVQEDRREEIAPCIGDHDGCMERLHAGKSTSCTVNPACGHEQEWRLRRVKKPLRLTVVGGGPAGMEAARVASLRGIEVTLWEKSDSLGGNLLPASVPDFKRDIRNLINYQVRQLNKVRVQVELCKEVASREAINPGTDFIIIATGARAKKPNLPGIERQRVRTAVETLLHPKSIGRDVVVVGAGLVGCETAAYLARVGHRVTLTSRRPRILADMCFHNGDLLLKMMLEAGVKILTNTLPLRFEERGLMAMCAGQEQLIEADGFVFDAGMEPNNNLLKALEGTVPRVLAVGDCVRPGRIIDAFWQAFHAARRLGKTEGFVSRARTSG